MGRLPTMVEVAEGVVVVTGTHTNWVVLLEGGEATLVDSGYYRDADLVRACLNQLRTRAPRLAAIVLTHAHVDHLGCAARLRRELGVPVLVRDAEVPHATGAVIEQISPLVVARNLWRPRWMRWTVEIMRAGGPKADRVTDPQPFAADGSALPVPGSPVPIATPGHTTGHTSFHLPERNVVLAGDALCTEHALSPRRGPQVLPAPFQHDLAGARQALAALAELPADVVVPGHGPAFRGSAREAVQLALRV
jgi:glyoxylase-like metal-dependent hydrolase (beta-lactamase superfamily II)